MKLQNQSPEISIKNQEGVSKLWGSKWYILSQTKFKEKRGVLAAVGSVIATYVKLLGGRMKLQAVNARDVAGRALMTQQVSLRCVVYSEISYTDNMNIICNNITT